MLCRNLCGRGTLSTTGYCAKCAPGQAGAQGRVLREMRRAGCGVKQMEIQRKKEEEAERAEWDAYIDSLCDDLEIPV